MSETAEIGTRKKWLATFPANVIPELPDTCIMLCESCAGCGHEFRSVRFRERHGLYVMPGTEGGPVDLVYRCPRCGLHRDGGGGADVKPASSARAA